ncbi:MAG TPA: peptide ABC transporter substrate-binding protein [Ktedonobacteraceae bacterium]|nr:peptide ABC transporter substrate-binding protein [Ktedonobacteraceae bacterium]
MARTAVGAVLAAPPVRMLPVRQVSWWARQALPLLLIWLVVACSTTPSMPPSPPHGSTSGTIIFADRGFPDAVNPLFSASAVDLEVSAALWSAPVYYDNRFHIQPDQLTEVPLPANGGVKDDGKTIIMHLRHDLRWSDGQPILASDFQYWWHLDQDPNTGAITMSGYDQIASIDTPDNFTVILHMKHAYGPYLSYLPYAAPQHAWGKLKDIDLQNMTSVYLAPTVTDGPYMLAHFENGKSYTLKPDPYYTSTTFSGPFVSQLIYRSYNDLTALTGAVKQQQVDISEGYMEDDLSSLVHLPAGVQLRETPAASYEHLDFNLARPIFQDVRVRRAIQMAINRCAIIEQALHMPDCSRLADQVEPPPSLVYDSSIASAPFDPHMARQLLAQAGWLSGQHGLLYRHGQPFALRLVTTASNPLRAAAARRIQQDLLAAGISIQILYYPLNTFFGLYNQGGILATGAYDLAMFGYQNSPEPDDEYAVFDSSQIPTADQPGLGNYGRVKDPIIDQALQQGRNTVGFAGRVKFYHQFLERLADQVYIIPLYTGLNIMTISATVRNVVPNPNVVENNWNISEWRKG